MTSGIDALPKELELYLWARRLRVLHRFNRACLHQELTCYDVMQDLYTPEARSYVRHVSWALTRCFHGVSDLPARVLMYLDVAHVAPRTHTATFVSAVREGTLSRLQECGLFVSPTLPHLAAGPSTSGRPATETQPDTPHLKRPRVETPTNGIGPLAEPSSSSLPPLELQPQSPNPRLSLRANTPPPPASPGGSHVPAEREHHQPTFFVRPPYNHVTTLFARMLSPSLLNDEELNRYFGRYGQVSSRRIRSVAVGVGGAFDGATRGSEAALHMSVERSVSKRGGPANATEHLQDFIIDIDLPQNAMAALTELRHSAILFVAPHDGACNVYSSDCLDEAMQSAAAAWAIESKEGVHDGTADEEDDFIPELILDNVPYWFTPAQLTVNCSVFGDVLSTRFSIDDRSGAFTGVALLQMGTSTATKKAAAGLHGKELEPDTDPLICGVLDASFNIVSLLDPSVVLKKRGGAGAMPMCSDFDGSGKTEEGRRVSAWSNPRVWL